MIGKFIGSGEGFTIVEVMVVVALAGIMVAVLLPLSDNFVSSSGLEGAAEQIKSDIRWGEQKALAEECSSYKIKFMIEREEYRLYFDQEDTQSYRAKKLPSTVDLVYTNFSNHKLNINAKGTAASGGTISLKDDNDNWLYIKVQPVTGRVRVTDEN